MKDNTRCTIDYIESYKEIALPSDELQEVLESWQEKAEWYSMRARTIGQEGASQKAQAYRECVNELEELINE